MAWKLTRYDAHGVGYPEASGQRFQRFDSHGKPVVNGGSGGTVNFVDVIRDVINDAISSNQDNYNPVGFDTASVLLIEPTGADRFISGIEARSNAQILIVNTSDTFILTLESESSDSLPANRFTGDDFTQNEIRPHGSIFLYYSDALARWDMVNLVADLGQAAGILNGSHGGTDTSSIAQGDLLVGGPSGGFWQTLAAGSVGTFLKVSSTGVLGWLSIAASDIASGILALVRGGTGSNLSATGPGAVVQATSGAALTVETLNETRGGTHQTSFVQGDILAATAANTLSKINITVESIVARLTGADVAALTASASTILARLASGSVGFQSVANIKTLLAYLLSDLGDVSLSGIAQDDVFVRGATAWNNLNMGASTILARLASGHVVAASVAQIKTLLAYVLTDLGDVSFTSVAQDDVVVRGSSTWNNVAIAAQRIVGRITGGHVTALTASNVWSILAAAIDADLVATVDATNKLGSSAKKWLDAFLDRFTLAQVSAPSAPGTGDVTFWADTADQLWSIAHSGQLRQLIGGKKDLTVKASNTTAVQTAVTATLKASVLSASGWVRTEAIFLFFNNSGAGRALTVTFNFGSYSKAITFGAQTASTTNEQWYQVIVYTFNDAVTGTQFHMYRIERSGQVDSGVAGTLSNNGQWESSSVDTTVDVTVSLTGTMPTNTSSQILRGVGLITGP